MSDDLFTSYEKSRLDIKSVAIGLVALVVLSAAGYGAYQWTRPVPPSVDDILAVSIRNSSVLMLDYPRFSGEEFREQMLGKGKLEKYIRVTDEAFFTFPDSDPAEFDDFITRNFHDRTKIEFGKNENGVVRLGDRKIPAEYAPNFFRTGLANIKVPSDRTLTFPYSTVNYTLSLKEMNDFVSGSIVYGGKPIVHESDRGSQPTMMFANHGIMVAKPDEPSLKRLVDDLLKGTPPDREAKIQRLTDFVSSEIEYSFSEAVGRSETLKRADETLMTRNGDCSNKTILLASLLEQSGEEYILLYCPRHITVAVPQGNFPNQNKVDFDWENRKWVVAETTLPGFQLGISRLQQPGILQLVNYVQDPKHMQMIFDANGGGALQFF